MKWVQCEMDYPDDKNVARLLLVFELSGVFPFRLKNGRLAFSFLGTFVGTFRTVFFTATHWLWECNSTSVKCALTLAFLTVISFMPLYSVIVFYLNRSKINSSLISIIKTYHLLNRHSVHLPYNIINISALVLLTFFVTNIALSVYIIQGHATIMNIAYLLLLNIFIVVEGGLFLIFSIFVDIVGKCLSTANDTIMKTTGEMRSIIVNKYVLLLNRLGDESENMNECFDKQLLVILANNTYFIITELYDWSVAYTSIQSSWLLIFIHVVAILVPVQGILAIFYCCDSASKKWEKFTNILSNIALDETNGRTGKISESQQVIQIHLIIGKKLKFTTFGGLVLDYRLLLSLIATCVTYLMILLQFNDRSGCPSKTQNSNETLSS